MGLIIGGESSHLFIYFYVKIISNRPFTIYFDVEISTVARRRFEDRVLLGLRLRVVENPKFRLKTNRRNLDTKKKFEFESTMGRRKDRMLAAMSNAGRRVKLDLSVEPSGKSLLNGLVINLLDGKLIILFLEFYVMW